MLQVLQVKMKGRINEQQDRVHPRPCKVETDAG
jgi:hypothetical protein